MNKRKKVYLAIIIIEISIMLFAYSAYFMFFFNKSASNINPVATNNISNTPSITITSAPSKAPTTTEKSESNEPVSYVKTAYKPKKYLYKNPIDIEEMRITDSKGLTQIEMSYPKIKGLKDKTIESKINKDIQTFFEGLAKDCPSIPDKKVTIHTYYYIQANYNNIFSFQVHYAIFPENIYNNDSNKNLNDYYSYMHSKSFGLVFDLSTGKQLSIKDSFVYSSDYKTPINKEISTEIFKASLDENNMKRPFKGLEECSSFYVGPNELFIIFPSESSVFVSNLRSPYDYEQKEFALFKIPFYKLEGTVDIFDKFTKSSNNIYEDEVKDKLPLENDFVIKLSAPSKEIGSINLFTRSFKIEDFSDKIIQEKINTDIKSNIIKMSDEEGLKKIDTKGNKYYKSVNADCVGNISGYLCIRYHSACDIPEYKNSSTDNPEFYPDYTKYSIYDLKTGKIVKIDALFTDKTSLSTSMNRTIKKILAEKKINPVDYKGYEFIADKIQIGFDSNAFNISLNNVTIGSTSVTYDTCVSYEELDKNSIVFFK